MRHEIGGGRYRDDQANGEGNDEADRDIAMHSLHELPRDAEGDAQAEGREQHGPGERQKPQPASYQRPLVIHRPQVRFHVPPPFRTDRPKLPLGGSGGEEPGHERQSIAFASSVSEDKPQAPEQVAEAGVLHQLDAMALQHLVAQVRRSGYVDTHGLALRSGEAADAVAIQKASGVEDARKARVARFQAESAFTLPGVRHALGTVRSNAQSGGTTLRPCSSKCIPTHEQNDDGCMQQIQS